MGVEICPWEGEIFGHCAARLKALGVFAVTYAAKWIIKSSIVLCSRMNLSILNNGTTCDAAFSQNSLTICFGTAHLVLNCTLKCMSANIVGKGIGFRLTIHPFVHLDDLVTTVSEEGLEQSR